MINFIKYRSSIYVVVCVQPANRNLEKECVKKRVGVAKSDMIYVALVYLENPENIFS